jgi:hypothetical protein
VRFENRERRHDEQGCNRGEIRGEQNVPFLCVVKKDGEQGEERRRRNAGESFGSIGILIPCGSRGVLPVLPVLPVTSPNCGNSHWIPAQAGEDPIFTTASPPRVSPQPKRSFSVSHDPITLLCGYVMYRFLSCTWFQLCMGPRLSSQLAVSRLSQSTPQTSPSHTRRHNLLSRYYSASYRTVSASSCISLLLSKLDSATGAQCSADRAGPASSR